jgi:hypothetical protein
VCVCRAYGEHRLSTLFSFLAIPRVGLAIGQGVWGGVAILVSFLWGAIGPSEISNPLRSLPLSAMAIGYLLFGIYGILLSARYSTTGGAGGTSNPTASDDETEALLAEGPESETGVQLTEGGSQRGGRFAAGMVCAVLVGLFGGSILAPLAFVSDELSGIGFLPSFGIGAFASGVLIDGTYLVVHARTSPSLGVIVRTALPGMAAGLVWNAGNVCSILAMGSIGNLSCTCVSQNCVHKLRVQGRWGRAVNQCGRWGEGDEKRENGKGVRSSARYRGLRGIADEKRALSLKALKTQLTSALLCDRDMKLILLTLPTLHMQMVSRTRSCSARSSCRGCGASSTSRKSRGEWPSGPFSFRGLS